MAQWPTNPDYSPLTQINKGNEFDAGDGLIADDVNKIVKNTVAYVKANPTGSGTVDLTGLKVGETVYNIPQGGGTTVVANPTLAGTETELTGLTINGTNYKINTFTVTENADGTVDLTIE